jgi:hypothetical protein
MLVVLTRSHTLNMVSQHGISFSLSQAFIEAFVGFEVGNLFNHVLWWDNHQTFDLIWIWLRHWEQIHLNPLHVWRVICCSHLDDGTERLEALSSDQLFTVFKWSFVNAESVFLCMQCKYLTCIFYVIHTMYFLVFCIFRNQQNALIKIQ